MKVDCNAISLSELTQRITATIATNPSLTNVWITAETSDVRSSGGHCYMELIDKDESTGLAKAKCRAMIWASAFARLSAKFYATTGSRLRSDMKIMARVSVSYHSVYGFSLVINDIDPDYTVGDLVRRRNNIIARLQADGVYDLNKSLPWSDTPCRIAIISARGAAGYGDFIKHLYHNPYRLRFDAELFEATMQGERTSDSIISALERIMERIDDYDCVVIIRGGGAVSDLASFDDYDLACNVAQFPLPIIVGIGHERDINVLDFVANVSVKTPTAAAEVLIGRMAEAMTAVMTIGRQILATVTDRISGERQQLAFYQGNLPAMARNVIDRNRHRIGDSAVQMIKGAVSLSLARRADRLKAVHEIMKGAVTSSLARSADRLKAMDEMIETISPEATLRRGYSITRYKGHAVDDVDSLPNGAIISTTFAKGKVVTSTICREK
ncbi:MAG: exodeoxyribonuclease VII large subunit [Muribaculaceae bacterium]|nr:exodeoxyribonuclease VII large subunit [Muribaculaceae bacterium]